MAIASLSSVATGHAWFFGPGWPDIPPEELALASPRIDPEAGAEILYREIQIDDSDSSGTTYQYYMRTKVFDERGVEKMKQVELDTIGSQRINRVYARVTRSDGTTEELERDAVHKREIVRLGSFKANRTSFALPGLTPGCIVDYKWTIKASGSAYGYRLFTQVELPTHQLRFRMKFYPYLTGRWTGQGLPSDSFQKSSGKWFELNLNDQPAFKTEPFSPPPSAVQPWLLIHYGAPGTHKDEIADYWKDQAKQLHRLAREDFEPRNRLIREKTAELIEGVSDPTEKLRILYDFCQREIKNMYHTSGGFSDREREKLRYIDSPKEALKFGYGHSFQINALFGSMALAAGFDAQWVMCSDRSDTIFTTMMTYGGAMPDLFIGVRDEAGGGWRFYCPGLPYLGFGQLDWSNEGTTALINNEGEAGFLQTTLLPAKKSTMSRRGTLTLEDTGDLTGEVEIVYTGHLATIGKRRYDSLTEAERSKELEEEVQEEIGRAEISNVRFENVLDPALPLTIRYALRIPGYADRTAQRMFFEPFVLQHGSEPIFTEEVRKSFIYVPFPFEETDELSIQLPEGWELEEASAPGQTVDADALGYEVRLRFAPKSRTMLVKRTLRLSIIAAQQDAYPVLKQVFTDINRSDHHLLTLRRATENEEVPALTTATPATTTAAAVPASL